MSGTGSGTGVRAGTTARGTPVGTRHKVERPLGQRRPPYRRRERLTQILGNEQVQIHGPEGRRPQESMGRKAVGGTVDITPKETTVILPRGQDGPTTGFGAEHC